jgi:hypothetical protein
MLTAILMIALAQTPVVHSTVTLEPVQTCATCDALTARVVALEARLAAATAPEPVRRVRLIEVPQSAPAVTYTAPSVVTYRAPLGVELPAMSAWAPGSYTVAAPTYVSPGASYMSSSYVERRGLFGGRLFGGSRCTMVNGQMVCQ